MKISTLLAMASILTIAEMPVIAMEQSKASGQQTAEDKRDSECRRIYEARRSQAIFDILSSTGDVLRIFSEPICLKTLCDYSYFTKQDKLLENCFRRHKSKNPEVILDILKEALEKGSEDMPDMADLAEKLKIFFDYTSPYKNNSAEFQSLKAEVDGLKQNPGDFDAVVGKIESKIEGIKEQRHAEVKEIIESIIGDYIKEAETLVNNANDDATADDYKVQLNILKGTVKNADRIFSFLGASFYNAVKLYGKDDTNYAVLNKFTEKLKELSLAPARKCRDDKFDFIRLKLEACRNKLMGYSSAKQTK